MKKIVWASLLATSLMATNNENFFGISTGNTQLGVKINGTDFNTDGTCFNVSLGHYYGDTSRIFATYSYVDKATGVDSNDAFSLAYDFLLPLNENKFLLYAGPVVGYTRYKESSDGTSLDLSSFHYGAQAGAIVRIINNIEIEAGYRYLQETGKDTFPDVNIELNNIKSCYIGANLRF
jgi:opacity protein-like surface antigen